MLGHFIVLKTFKSKQAIFLVDLRKSESKTKAELQASLVNDLWSRRYKCRRIAVQYEWLQREVALALFWKQRAYCSLVGKSPNYLISAENVEWVSCLHRAADMINECIEIGYLKCVGTNTCNLLQITISGSQYGSPYPVLIRVLNDVALALFARGQEIAKKAGLILVDTKYEFGYDENGKLMLIDEIHTQDSSRYWQADTYVERAANGKEPEYFDKEFLRLWFKDHCDPYKDETLPEAPEDMRVELARRYIEIYERLSGKKFEIPEVGDVAARIEANLR